MDKQVLQELTLWAKSSEALVLQDTKPIEVEPCEQIVLSTSTSSRTGQALRKLGKSVTQRIILTGVYEYGNKARDNGLGVWYGIRSFLYQQPEWSVVSHDHAEGGLTVLSRLRSDKPKLPPIIKQVANFTEAVARHVTTASGNVPTAVYEQRLDLCAICDHRVDKKCSLCGCLIETKAAWADSLCPSGRWNLPLTQLYDLEGSQ